MPELLHGMSGQHVMASLPAIAEVAAAEEQMLVAEASSVSRNADLKKMRQDKREFIKVSRFLFVFYTCMEFITFSKHWLAGNSLGTMQHKVGRMPAG